METIPAGESAAVAWERMRLGRMRHMAVVDPASKICGVVSASDLGGRHGADVRARHSVGDLMTAKLVVATPGTTVREAANLLRGHAINCLPVVERGRLVGIVTTFDLLELIGRGVQRPVITPERRILRDRGVKPRALARAKRTARTPLAK